MFVPHRKHSPSQLVTGIALLLYVDDVRTSQETHSFSVCYEVALLFYMEMMFVPHRKHRPPQLFAETALLFIYIYIYIYIYIDVSTSQETHSLRVCYRVALLFYMEMMFVSHRKHSPPQLVMGKALLL
jgi:hypothetical protein